MPPRCLLIGPRTHDELEVVDAELTVRTRARRTRHHGANGLVVEPILVHAQDVRLHLSGIDRPTLSRVTHPLFRKRRLQARIRLVDVLSKDSLEARRHPSLDKGGSVRCCRADGLDATHDAATATRLIRRRRVTATALGPHGVDVLGGERLGKR